MTTAADIAALGYSHVRQLTAGPYAGMWIGLRGMIFTTGLCVMDEEAVLTRFCFESWTEAVEAVETWDGHGWPPGMWLKQKPQDIPNPRGLTDAGRTA